MITRPVAAALLVLAVLAAAPAAAQEALPPYPRARQLASQKSWEPAREAALEATELEPGNARAWYLLGVIEERLGHAGSGASAYGKAADLEGGSPLGKAAAERRKTLGAKADGDARASYNQESAGFSVEYVPRLSPGPGYGGRLGDKVENAFGLGFRAGSGTGNLALMMRYASGKVPRYTSPAATPGGTPTLFTNGDHQFFEFRFEFAVPVVKPYGKLGLVGLDLPLSLNIAYATLKATGKKTCEDALFGVSGGLRVSLYTRSPFLFSAAALYNFTKTAGMSEYGHDPVRGPTGLSASGTFSGLEVRVGLTLLFGNTLPPELD
jgi:tetratricopeptide (TPR) repeat protein